MGTRFKFAYRFDISQKTINVRICRINWVKKISKTLKRIRTKVKPFNQCNQEKKKNPFCEGEQILIFQQRMERDHKLFPKWRGPFTILKIISPFQIMYNDCGREKISHITFCKKVLVAGKLAPNDRSNQLINCQTQTTPLSQKRRYKRNPQVRTFNSLPQRLNLGTNMFIHHITFISAAGRVAVYDLDDWPKEGFHYPDDAEVEVQWKMNQFYQPQSKRLEQALRTLGCRKRTLTAGEVLHHLGKD